MAGDTPSSAATPLPDAAWMLCLASLPRMGPRRLDALVAGRSVEAVWRDLVDGGRRVDAEVARRCGAHWSAIRTEWVQAARLIDPPSLWSAHRRHTVVVRGDAGYPVRLVDDPEPPPLLVVDGELAVDGPVVSIVGTRRCTGYGRDVARALGRDLAAAGVVVASGLALGIDGAAHAGALDVDGAPPLGVVATGLDVVYPARHRRLWRQVADRGAVISEAPLGTEATRWRFPARNRILAGIADAVVVVESHPSGGSLYTVASALERNVAVLVVPGPVTSPASAGTNELIVDGAVPVRGVDDVLGALGLAGRARRVAGDQAAGGRAGAADCDTDGRARSGAADPDDGLADASRAVLAAIDVLPTTVDTVALRTGRSLRALHVELVDLQRRGLASHEAGWWRLSPRGQRAAAGSS